MPGTMKVPSGKTFTQLDIEIIEGGEKTGFLKWYDEPQELASGKRSHIYVHGREDVTEHPQFLRLCCRKVLLDVRMYMNLQLDNRIPRFIGIPHVAHGWTPALAMVDAYEGITGRNACFAIMRSEPKQHGVHKGQWIARSRDPLSDPLYRDIQFDNTVTDMGSKVLASERMIEDGLKMSEIDGVVFVDRQQGGLKKMESLGYRHVHACYHLLDMTFALQKLLLWPDYAAELVEQEIRENQFE